MGCCTFVSGVTITVVVPSSVSTVRLFPERRVITPLPFTLSEAWAAPKAIRHTASKLATTFICLSIVISSYARPMTRFVSVIHGFPFSCQTYHHVRWTFLNERHWIHPPTVICPAHFCGRLRRLLRHRTPWDLSNLTGP